MPRVSSTDQIAWSFDNAKLPEDLPPEDRADLVLNLFSTVRDKAQQLGFDIHSIAFSGRAHHFKTRTNVTDDVLMQFRELMEQTPLAPEVAAA